MKIIYNNILPPKGFAAINIFGVIFVRKGIPISKRLLNHEAIHTAQMKSLFYVFFYLLYVCEWFIRLVQYRNSTKAYYTISFEREAYTNDCDMDYLKKRKAFNWVKYFF